MHRRTALIAINVRWLGQALQLLDRIDDTAYAAIPVGMAPHRPGGHLRHIIEFYRAFLDGLANRRIDYDARRRDLLIERWRDAAAVAIRGIIFELETDPRLRAEATVWVRMEDASDVPRRFMKSSISRELQVLSSHTIHHFALIAMTLRGHGVMMNADFGMAPSTLRFLASQVAEAA
jgi:hypothetical protein